MVFIGIVRGKRAGQMSVSTVSPGLLEEIRSGHLRASFKYGFVVFRVDTFEVVACDASNDGMVDHILCLI